MIPFFNPDIHDNHPNLDDAVRTYSVGPGRFCETLKPILRQASGGLHPVLTVSGTVALELCLRALGLEGKRIMLPAYGVVATMNAVANVGEPVFVDVDEVVGTLTAKTLEECWRAAGCRADAVVYVWQGGRKEGRDVCLAWARERGMAFIDDAACAYGESLDGADAGIVSFSGPKIVSCGQGGVALFRDTRAANAAYAMTDHGLFWRRTGDSHGPGTNMRLSDLQAAFLLDEIARLPTRRARAAKCVKAWGRHKLVKGFHTVCFGRDKDRIERAGIKTAYSYPSFWDHSKQWGSAARRINDGAAKWTRALHLPFGPGLTPGMVEKIVAAL